MRIFPWPEWLSRIAAHPARSFSTALSSQTLTDCSSPPVTKSRPGQPPAVWAVGQAHEPPGPAGQDAEQRTGRHVTDLDSPIVAGGRDAPAVRAEHHGRDDAAVDLGYFAQEQGRPGVQDPQVSSPSLRPGAARPI